MMREDHNSQSDRFAFGDILERERMLREELKRSKELDETKDSWRRFAGSGKIGDYLDYLRDNAVQGADLPKVK